MYIYLGLLGLKGKLEWGLELEGSCWLGLILSCTKSKLNENQIPVGVKLGPTQPQLVLNIYRKRFNFDYD